MPRQNINVGNVANDGTGDPLRTAFDKINNNFVEVYANLSSSSTSAPSDQILYGTGSSTTSSANLTYNSNTGILAVGHTIAANVVVGRGPSQQDSDSTPRELALVLRGSANPRAADDLDSGQFRGGNVTIQSGSGNQGANVNILGNDVDPTGWNANLYYANVETVQYYITDPYTGFALDPDTGLPLPPVSEGTYQTGGDAGGNPAGAVVIRGGDSLPADNAWIRGGPVVISGGDSRGHTGNVTIQTPEANTTYRSGTVTISTGDVPTLASQFPIAATQANRLGSGTPQEHHGPVGLGGAGNINLSAGSSEHGGNINLTAGNGIMQGGSVRIRAGDSTPGFLGYGSYTNLGGSVVLEAGSGEPGFGDSNSSIVMRTGGNNQLIITSGGSWRLGSSYGTAGQVLTSNGASSPPTWTTVSGGGNYDGLLVRTNAIIRSSEVVSINSGETVDPGDVDQYTADSSGQIIYYSGDITGDWTIDMLELDLGVGQATSIRVIVNQTSTAGLPTQIKIDGISQTVKWRGGLEPTGNVNQVDVVVFSVVCLDDDPYTGKEYLVLGQAETFI